MNSLANIYTILEQLEKRKALFLGNEYSFQSLNSFIWGYQFAATDTQLETADAPHFGYFNTWILGHIKKHYGLSGGWHWQIHNRNLNNDSKAFEDFFSLLKIFKGSAVSSKTIPVDEAARNYSVNGSVKRLEGPDFNIKVQPPHAIRFINITNSTIIYLEFLDEYDNTFYSPWHLNKEEAYTALEREFGSHLKVR